MINLGEHVSIFGISGCGKSTLTRKIAAVFPRRIIFDRLGEWDAEHVAQNFETFKNLYREFHTLQNFTILIRPRAGMPQDELLQLTNAVLHLIYQVENYDALGLLLVFEEIWLYSPLHSTPPWLLELYLTGRHARISILGNSQRPANVSKTLVSQSRHVFVGQFFEARDRDYFNSCLGNRPELENPPKKYNFLWFRADSAGEKPILITTN